MFSSKSAGGLYILHLSIHGLVRGERMELGRDADTGGQVLYVVELARDLSNNPAVARVDLLTRQIFDIKCDLIYYHREELIAENARIVRLPCGPKRYLRKESLWPYLDSFADSTLQYIRSVGRIPDIIHGHYADAGYVAAKLGRLLGTPMAFTGHSLGRVKKARMIEKGVEEKSLESRFKFGQRIEAEEMALEAASFVVASTRQEIEEQYALYDHYVPDRMAVIPPGVDLQRFSPPPDSWKTPPVGERISRFLSRPDKPMLLAMARPDARKNIGTLVEAYAGNRDLREKANLVLVLGNRDNLREMSKSARKVLLDFILQIDRHGLYGSVAYPKHHAAEEVPDIYRLAAHSGGIFVNPALTEPFGLTLIEAAASGLPVAATNDGGPRDIIAACGHGRLIDPLDAEAMGRELLDMLSDEERRQRWSQAGIEGSARHYTWKGHVCSYITKIEKALEEENVGSPMFSVKRSRLPTIDRLVIADVDNTLTGDDEALRELIGELKAHGDFVGFGIATGRSKESALAILEEMSTPFPDVLITSVGTSIFYGEHLAEDRSWRRHIDFHWQPDDVRKLMARFAERGVALQPKQEQGEFKISYVLDGSMAPKHGEIKRFLRREGLRVKVVFSLQAYLDILPVRASTGLAIRYLAWRWGIPPDRLLIAGDSGNDEEMLSGNTLGVVVGNFSPELEGLRGKSRIYFAEGRHARGILEGIEYYNFFGEIQIPELKEPAP